MAYSRYSRSAAKHSHHWLGVLAFIVLFIVGISGVLLWRVQSIAALSVHDTSMAPLLENGEGVIVAKTKAIEAGDIISYYSPFNQTDVLTRRVISVDVAKDAIITKSDSATKADTPFSRTLLIGKVRYHVTGLGYALDFLRSTDGLVFGIYLPAAVIISLEIRRLTTFYDESQYRLPGYPMRLS